MQFRRHKMSQIRNCRLDVSAAVIASQPCSWKTIF
jgi:hypothetical protein